MAVQPPASGPKFNIAGNNTYVLGEGDETEASSMVVHIKSNSGTGTIVVKARSATLIALKGNDDIAFLPIPYHSMTLNGSVGTGALVSTGITTDSIIVIPSTGMQVALDITGWTTGSFDVYFVPRAGNPSI